MIALLLVLSACGGATEGDRVLRAQPPLPDLSGLAWIEGEAFLAVHDAKVPEEEDSPRISVVERPPTGGPLRWTPLEVRWPPATGRSHDLESIARVPGTSVYLLAESGDGASSHRRIFAADLSSGVLTIRDVVDWPVPVFDVEGTAVAHAGGRLYFVFAERAHGEPRTRIAWAPLTLDPLEVGAVQAVDFRNPMPDSVDTRPVSALEIDGEGRIWTASAYDPDRDDGPFCSAVWEIGRFGACPGGEGQVHLSGQPRLVAILDGLKAESLAMRATGRGAQLVVGTDDEDFGGALWEPLPRARCGVEAEDCGAYAWQIRAGVLSCSTLTQGIPLYTRPVPR